MAFIRPNIAYAIRPFFFAMYKPREPHLNASKRIIWYLKGTMHPSLHLYPSTSYQLIAYTDVDWGVCPDTRRSTSSYCVFLGDILISWSAKWQPTLSWSSVEAEYWGVANMVIESCWLRNLLLELHTPLKISTLVYCDNVAAVYPSGNPFSLPVCKYLHQRITLTIVLRF